MRERPILMSGTMVRAILEGRKTQTRRVVKLPPAPMKLGQFEPTNVDGFNKAGKYFPPRPALWHTRNGATVVCPYGIHGDRLWVRETWRSYGERGRGGEIERFMYRAGINQATDGWKWKPGIHMPRRACRLVLEVTAVRVKRLQEISVDDAIAEGVVEWGTREAGRKVFDGRARGIPYLVNAYAELWNSLNAKRGFGWEKNPWVWCISFSKAAP